MDLIRGPTYVNPAFLKPAPNIFRILFVKIIHLMYATIPTSYTASNMLLRGMVRGPTLEFKGP